MPLATALLRVLYSADSLHFLYTLGVIYVATHQLLGDLRYGPAVLVVFGFVTTLLAALSRRLWRSPSSNKHAGTANPNSVKTLGIPLVLGALMGLQYVFFIWSLLKLAPPTGLALHILAIPFSRLVLSFLPLNRSRPSSSSSSLPLTTLLTIFILLLVIDSSAPMNPHALLLGSLALILDVSQVVFRAKYPRPPFSSTFLTMMLPWIGALASSTALTIWYGKAMFGKVLFDSGKAWIYPGTVACVTAFLFAASVAGKLLSGAAGMGMGSANVGVGVAVLVVSSVWTGLKERIGWSDVVAFLIVGGLAVVEARNSSGAVPMDVEAGAAASVRRSIDDKDMREVDQFLANDGNVPSSPSPSSKPPSNPTPLTTISSHTPRSPLLTLILVLLPLLYLLLVQTRLLPIPPSWDRRLLAPSHFTYTPLPHTHTTTPLPSQPPEVEFVISYYDEHIPGVVQMIKQAWGELPHWTKRVTVYHKGLGNVNETGYDEKVKEWLNMPELEGLVDTVVGRPNVGRDGGTHLRHIIENYDNLAGFTIFMQGHTAFEWEYEARLRLINERTGFLSFGHYVTVDGPKGHDNWCNCDFGHVKELWEMLQPSLPYNITHLSTYQGEFGVSRERILRNPKRIYEEIINRLEAPAGSPIYTEDGHWDWKGVPDGPANPFYGHAVERAWTFMFNCWDPKMEDACPFDGPVGSGCYCADDLEWKVQARQWTSFT